MIEIANVSKRFGRISALHGVSLRVEPGERLAIVGANGSGKTTLLRALLGLLRVTGRVTVAGFDVAMEPERALAHVAYIPQISPPLDAAVSEVIRAYAAFRGITAQRIDESMRRMGLTLPAIGRLRFRDLSGGMKQKLLAALALATTAEVLVCDEPTANLDAEARAAFFSALDRRSPGGIVVLCSHREDEVHSFVERVIELREGRLARDERLANAARLRLRAVQ
jgi:ABC-type multidrug transport system ATPase subunit